MVGKFQQNIARIFPLSIVNNVEMYEAQKPLQSKQLSVGQHMTIHMTILNVVKYVWDIFHLHSKLLLKLRQKNSSNHCSNRGPCYTEFMVHEAVLRRMKILSNFLFSVISQREKYPLGSNLPCLHGCNKSGLCDRWI